jgi:glucose/mannose transport system substrate-binding protein
MLNASQSHEIAQKLLIKVMVSKRFQEAFNLEKGSIPARIDTDMSRFDDCAKKSHIDFLSALKTNHVIRHFDTSVTDEQRAVIYKVVSTFMHHPAVSSAEAVQQLQRCFKNPQMVGCS